MHRCLACGGFSTSLCVREGQDGETTRRMISGGEGEGPQGVDEFPRPDPSCLGAFGHSLSVYLPSRPCLDHDAPVFDSPVPEPAEGPTDVSKERAAERETWSYLRLLDPLSRTQADTRHLLAVSQCARRPTLKEIGWDMESLCELSSTWLVASYREAHVRTSQQRSTAPTTGPNLTCIMSHQVRTPKGP